MPDLLEKFEAESPKTDMRPFQEWDRHMSDGERMLWEGFPSLKSLNKNRTNSAKILGFSLLFFAAIILLFPYAAATLGPAKLALSRIIAVLFAIAGIGILTLGSKLINRLGVRTTYGVSTAHAIILTRLPHLRIRRFPIDEMDEIHLIRGTFDAVYFAQRLVRQQQSPGPWEPISPPKGLSLVGARIEKFGF